MSMCVVDRLEAIKVHHHHQEWFRPAVIPLAVADDAGVENALVGQSGQRICVRQHCGRIARPVRFGPAEVEVRARFDYTGDCLVHFPQQADYQTRNDGENWGQMLNDPVPGQQQAEDCRHCRSRNHQDGGPRQDIKAQAARRSEKSDRDNGQSLLGEIAILQQHEADD
jgi:hypothetical protein